MCTLTDRLGSNKSTLDNFLRQVTNHNIFPFFHTFVKDKKFNYLKHFFIIFNVTHFSIDCILGAS